MDSHLQNIHQIMYPFLGLKIRQTRSGPTGAGYTHEDVVLGKAEDNYSVRDLDEGESKVFNLAAKNPKLRICAMNGGAEASLLTDYGYKTNGLEKRYQLSFRVGKERSLSRHGGEKRGMVREDNAFVLRCMQNKSYGFWPLDALEKKVNDKLSTILTFGYRKYIIDGEPHYEYSSVERFSGLTPSLFYTALEQQKLYWEFRLRETTPAEKAAGMGACRNRGTAIVASKKALADFYPRHETITWDSNKNPIYTMIKSS